MSPCENKKRYDPDMDMHVTRQINGELSFQYNEINWQLLGKPVKDTAKTVAKKSLSTAADKTGQYVGNKVGDKIIELLQKNKKNRE